eukprot:CAMPEP_0114286796 /NCGR_PEP_ID=MMETSP0059-20121206/5942_1 /TAXON_ID=36894 /ORGANISM="Pyramimonas parkeae, Strain CCMP726" /LENGTH=621 /DNA_ID=CAMNT_0001407847 /DNA_START=149 /DNA_END=2014 /DNA_ORIENTATION=+
MASTPGFMYKFPWDDWGNGKYLLMAPFLATVLLGCDDADNWSMHVLCIAAMRYLNAQLWQMASRANSISEKTRIQTKLLEFKQIDREDNWDDYIILQSLIMTLVHHVLPGYSNFPLFNSRGFWHCLVCHVGPTEFIYYWFHRVLHHHSLYSAYHSHHHASFLTEPVSGSCHPFLEHLGYTANFAIPMLGPWWLGTNSVLLIYTYLFIFDFLNAWGHCNFEVVPYWAFEAFPVMKYLLYTPSYHSLHHSRVHTNFCLFMPVYDYVYGTMDPKSDALHASSWEGGRMAGDAKPDVVFLAHGTEMLSVFHLPFMGRNLSAHPFRPSWYLYPLYPLAVVIFLFLRVFGTPFTAMKHRLQKMRLHVRVIPAWGVQYFVKSEHDRINNLLRRAIREGEEAGAKVIGLGALNKAEFLNAGGSIFVEEMPDIKPRIVHGNTLTTAVVLRTLPAELPEVFLTGATSKIGKAVALYLAAKGVKVKMLTPSKERFEALLSHAKPEHQGNLIHCTSLKEGSECSQWIVGKPLEPKDQTHAPKGTVFHQFVVPPLKEARKDCTYGQLPGMKLPDAVEGVHSAMMDMERRCVYACYAGAIVHAMENWQHHEVGAIDPARIDETWDAAMRHGFKLC